ncbi:hypothetical protein HCZ23_00305 [Celeribacter sp. HF31]|uniref:hypothetical protein n=1 Tax=Celeribacter sp. HF31 TaxID=2721558 RepID=UPI00143024F2|nr:hypothetical protein [Celeribacter sp. HF31]NIY77911.1 hypothetical protein [Celeribacter sp. HF31]
MAEVAGRMAACDGWRFVLAEIDIGVAHREIKKNIKQNQLVDRFTRQQKHSGIKSKTVEIRATFRHWRKKTIENISLEKRSKGAPDVRDTFRPAPEIRDQP